MELVLVNKAFKSMFFSLLIKEALELRSFPFQTSLLRNLNTMEFQETDRNRVISGIKLLLMESHHKQLFKTLSKHLIMEIGFILKKSYRRNLYLLDR